MAEQAGNRDLILALGQYCLVQDETKGHVLVYVGPTKTSLAGTDKPVTFDKSRQLFKGVELSAGITQNPWAPEGSYIVLENPAENDREEHPISTGSNPQAKLKMGRKVNIHGPATFPLWPGQVATVIEGHHLHSNEYLLVRVYNEEAANTNWDKMVIRRAGETAEGPDIQAAPKPNLTMGALLIIKGTEASFFMPPTGIEVVKEPKTDKFVREAVTLERLEYCILLSEGGTKRYVQGPAVVFPEPTETFMESGGDRKFRATELNDDMGIHVKVIEDYNEADGTQRLQGQELFITGKEQKIYFPCKEHAIVKYGERDIHFGVAIPAGEARYVLDKRTGVVETVKGPQILLPDPRHQVIVKRILDDRMVGYIYPKNEEARLYNASLRNTRKPTDEFVEDDLVGPLRSASRTLAAVTRGDTFQRGTTYTPPRSITLDTKYDGAVSMNVWTGYAVLLVKKTGERRVVVGPATVLLDYDETPQVLSLSTGKPKTTDALLNTVYLQVLHNQVSDIIEVTTKDMVTAKIKVSYRVNFQGQAEKWFDVENYVKLLCDHIRSMLRGVVRGRTITDLNDNGVAIVRDTILGAKTEGAARTGREFAENGMHVYEVEVLGIFIEDAAIANLLKNAQGNSVQQAIELAKLHQELADTKQAETLRQQIAAAKNATNLQKIDLYMAAAKKELEKTLAEITARLQQEGAERMGTLEELTDEFKLAAARRAETMAAVQSTIDKAAAELEAQVKSVASQDAVAKALLERKRADQELELQKLTETHKRTMEAMQKEIDGIVARAQAFGPQLVAALQAFGDKMVTTEVAKAVAPLALLGRKDFTTAFTEIVGPNSGLAAALAASVGIEGVKNVFGHKTNE